MDNPYGLDITEIEGFDDLHEPEEILREGMERAARVYGSEECWYLVNGSTAGILAGICAATQPGDRVLVARNCHKSVVNALILQQLEPVWLMPEAVEGWPVFGSVRPETVEEILERETGEMASKGEETIPPAAKDGGAIQAEKEQMRENRRGRWERKQISLVILTSPTYEGILSDLPRIVQICHSRGIPLLVDEAHGAHLGFGSFPAGAIAAGTDLVVQSLHKTLPAFTQTGLLHRQGLLVDGRRVKHALDVFQTSSPSYVLMAGIDRCIRFLEEEPQFADEWMQILEAFYRRCEGVGLLRLLREKSLPQAETERVGEDADDHGTVDSDRKMDATPGGDIPCGGEVQKRSVSAGKKILEIPGIWGRDPSKLVISVAGSGHTGPELMSVLRERYGFELEMAAADYVIAMTGAGDRPEALAHFADALIEIDEMWGAEEKKSTDTEEKGFKESAGEHGKETLQTHEMTMAEALRGEKKADVSGDFWKPRVSSWRPQPVLPLWRADRMRGIPVSLDESAIGRIGLEFVYAYPPGIPLLAPGEQITPAVLEMARSLRRAGIRLRGLQDAAGATIRVAEVGAEVAP